MVGAVGTYHTAVCATPFDRVYVPNWLQLVANDLRSAHNYHLVIIARELALRASLSELIHSELMLEPQ